MNINEIGNVQNVNFNSASLMAKTQKTQDTSIFSSVSNDNEPKVIKEGEIKVKGDDGKKYKAHEVVTQEVDESGKNWEVSVRTYTDDAGKTVKDTVKTHVYKERFGKEDVEITQRKITHITPDIKRTVEEEESKYHYAEKHEEWHGNEGISGSSKRSKVKQCKMPAGFSAKYLSTTKAIATLNLSDDN